MIGVLGEALIDIHSEDDELSGFPGGGPFNAAIALGRLGVPVLFLGALSRDRFGVRLQRTLEDAGVDTSRAPRVAQSTPLALIEHREGAETYAFYLPGTAYAALEPASLYTNTRDLRALHVGTLALATNPPAVAITRCVEEHPELNLLFLDPNVRPGAICDRDAYHETIRRLTRIATIVKLSDADIAWLYPAESIPEVVERLLGEGATCVVVTFGDRGASGWTRSAHAAVPAYDIEVVDTVGAGDAFGAGLLAWLTRHDRLDAGRVATLTGEELTAALTYAAATAAAQCTRPSAWGPTAEDVEWVLSVAGTSAAVRDQER